MVVAVVGETSGIVRDAFRRRGHDATSYDLLPSETSGPHVIGDVRSADLRHVDIVIAHPPCTRLCNSGVRWLHERNLWHDMEQAAEFFVWCMGLGKRNACENPIMHGHAVKIVGRSADQYVQPWQFGHGETKKTGLWLRGLPPLVPTLEVPGRVPRVHRLPPSPNRWSLRSRTYLGIAEAMAEQWGK